MGEDEPEYDEISVGGAEIPNARAASIVGLLGVGSLPGLLFCGLGAFLAVAALVLAPRATRAVAASDGSLGGLGLIRTARVCSVVSLLIATVFTVVLVIVLALIADR